MEKATGSILTPPAALEPSLADREHQPLRELLILIMRKILVLAVLPLSLVLSSCGKKQPASTTDATNETTATSTPGAAHPLEGQVDPVLTQQLRSFIERKGRLPADFAELARTSLDSRPRAPAGMKWEIDASTREVKLVKQ